jgi:hypothetical protein
VLFRSGTLTIPTAATNATLNGLIIDTLNITGTANARSETKREWINKIRLQRELLHTLIEKNMIEVLDIKFREEIANPINYFNNTPTLNALLNSDLLHASCLFREACEKGSFEVMKYFFDKYGKKLIPSLSFNYCFWRKVFKSNVDTAFLMIKWFHEHGFTFKATMQLYGHASGVDRLDIIQWIHKNLTTLPPPPYTEVMKPMFSRPVDTFNAEIVEFMFDKFPLINYTFSELLLNGPLTNDNIVGLEIVSKFAERYNVSDLPWIDALEVACRHNADKCKEWIVSWNWFKFRL